jgi:lipopolysaccharide/colanic/teichoic acid biosynthesis glycosyltransferase
VWLTGGWNPAIRVVVPRCTDLMSSYASTVFRWGGSDSMQQDVSSPIAPHFQPWTSPLEASAIHARSHRDEHRCAASHLQIIDIRPFDLVMESLHNPGGCMAILHVNQAGSYSATLIHAYDSSCFKRLLDVTISLLMILLLFPLMLMIATIVKIGSGGPILFRQRRVGKYGREFEMLKFRTMIPDWHDRKIGPSFRAEAHRRVHKSPHDARVTRVGRFLRRTSLDELPQLWNVLVGDMSLVGPRPELPHIVANYEPWQHARHLVQPGITGWWQVNRDGTRLMHETTDLDLYYVQHKSVRLDLEILIRTVPAVIRGTGAF